MTYLNFRPEEQGFVIRTLEGVRGRIIRKRGIGFQARLTRPVTLQELDGICSFVQELNIARRAV